MTTTVSQVTKSKQVLTRSWRDIDPKVRAAFAVLAGTAMLVVPSYLLGAISLHALELALIPEAATVAAAYIKTSTHKELVVKALGEAAKDAAILGPELEAARPGSGPVVAVVEDGVAALQAALTPETTDLAAVTAAVSDPSPSTAVIAAAAVSAPVSTGTETLTLAPTVPAV